MGEKLPGRVMALDLGEKRIGVAISDETRRIAGSHSVLLRKSRLEDFRRYAKIVSEHKVTLLVVGLPIRLDGEEGRQAAWVRDYTEEMRAHLNIPVEFWDEALSTRRAQESMRARGQRGRKSRERIDAVAAAFILQDFLDAHAQEDTGLNE